jgi:hypothetical protein
MLQVCDTFAIRQSGNTVTFIEFSGHGFKGNIDSLAKFTEDVSIAGLGHKDVTTISFTQQ